VASVPDNLRYSKEHEWIREEGEHIFIGITDYAQDQLGDIVFVELPKEGEQFSTGDAFGIIESVKSVSDVYAPLPLEIVETNTPLIESPETVNADPYGEGWMIKAKLSDASVESLLDPEEYEAYVIEEME